MGVSDGGEGISLRSMVRTIGRLSCVPSAGRGSDGSIRIEILGIGSSCWVSWVAFFLGKRGMISRWGLRLERDRTVGIEGRNGRIFRPGERERLGETLRSERERGE